MLKIPQSAVLESSSPGRMLWQYETDINGKISFRLNCIFLGVDVKHEEYITILMESKKNEGLEPREAAIAGGRGFTYETRQKKSDEEITNTYLVALSPGGWICTVTASGKSAVLKRELPLVTTVLQSFEFLRTEKKPKKR
ncbi:MAG: hypothetical protein RDV48_17645 [Candidatus Eremiobacteraeota bacterium]|nr:hypothetical protein [Candidatus Eremiobacteraeota bacterium]